MAFITAFRHTAFVDALDNSIKRFETLHIKDSETQKIVEKLKQDLVLLEKIYLECDLQTRQLKRLIYQYQDIQRQARIELRTCKHKSLKG
ncbi:MAG: hypothetical protein QM731_03030 [Chitinophagaceae bacterium]